MSLIYEPREGIRNMNSSPDAIDPRSRKTVSALITDRLVDDIQNGVLRPGSRLVQMDLVQRFNVSRVAIRDALMELRRRGLSVAVPLRGDIVRPISIKTVRDIFDLRRINEGHAIFMACNNISKEGIANLQSIIKEQKNLLARTEIAGFIDKDWEFHRSIFEFTDNEPLREIIESLWARTRQARSVAQREISWAPTWGKASIKRHQELLDALISRDAKLAMKIAEKTIQIASDELCQELRESGWDENLQEGK
jgi:DNA-binding GntR family transcriptional regulator